MPLARSGLVGFALLVAACAGESGVDWSKPEDFVLREKSTKTNDGIELDYWSLVDAPCQPLYDALADVEHYGEFVPGVDRTQLLAVEGNTKTILIAQRVIGRQSNAKVKWTYRPEQKEIDFTTLSSDLNYNDGRYKLEPSPDGARCLVRSAFLVKEGQGMAQAVPIGVLAAGTREAFLSAARGVKTRATSAAAR